jgi:general stress protein 26
MNIINQGNPQLTQLGELIKPMRVAMMTVADEECALISRPMAPLEMDADGAIWFFTDLHSAKVRQLSAVNLSFCNADDASYISICGRGEVHTDRETIERLWTAAAKPWFPNGKDSPNLALLKIVPGSAEYWDGPDSKMVRMFAMAASVIASKPIGMGEHNTLNDLSPVER